MDFCKELARRNSLWRPRLEIIVCLIVALWTTLPLRAAIVEAEDVPRYVDTPTGTVIVKGIPDPPAITENFQPEMPAAPRASSQSEPKRKVSQELPDAPDFDAKVEKEQTKPRDNRAFLILGILIILIGLALVFYIAKKRQDEA